MNEVNPQKIFPYSFQDEYGRVSELFYSEHVHNGINTDRKGEKVKLSSSKEVKEICNNKESQSAEDCYRASRKYLSLNMLREMKEFFEEALEIDSGGVAYDSMFETIGSNASLVEMAKVYADIAHDLAPLECGPIFNSAVATSKFGSENKAISKLISLANEHPSIASYAFLRAAQLLDKQGKTSEAILPYFYSLQADETKQGVYRSQIANSFRKCGHIEFSLFQYYRALDFDHIHVPELIEHTTAAKIPPVKNRLISQLVTLVEFESKEAGNILGKPANIFEWRNFFFAVPVSLGRVSALELCKEGLSRPGFRDLIDKFFCKFPLLYKLGESLLRRIIPGAVYRHERRLIRSAKSIEDLKSGNLLSGLADTWISCMTGYDMDLYFPVYWGGEYFAIPSSIAPISASDLELLRNRELRRDDYLCLFLGRNIWIVHWFGRILKLFFPEKMRLYNLLRIRRGKNLGELELVVSTLPKSN